MQIYQVNFFIFPLILGPFLMIFQSGEYRKCCCETLKKWQNLPKIWWKSTNINLLNLRLTKFSFRFPKMLTNPSLPCSIWIIPSIFSHSIFRYIFLYSYGMFGCQMANQTISAMVSVQNFETHMAFGLLSIRIIQIVFPDFRKSRCANIVPDIVIYFFASEHHFAIIKIWKMKRFPDQKIINLLLKDQ